MYLLKMCGPQIASKQLNILTTIDTLSGFSGAEVTYILWVQEVPG